MNPHGRDDFFQTGLQGIYAVSETDRLLLCVCRTVCGNFEKPIRIDRARAESQGECNIVDSPQLLRSQNQTAVTQQRLTLDDGLGEMIANRRYGQMWINQWLSTPDRGFVVQNDDGCAFVTDGLFGSPAQLWERLRQTLAW